MALILFCKLILRNEPYIQVTQVLTLVVSGVQVFAAVSYFWWRAVTVFRPNSFDGSVKPHYSLHQAKWTLIDTSHCHWVRGGREESALLGRLFSFSPFFCLILIPLALISEMLLFARQYLKIPPDPTGQCGNQKTCKSKWEKRGFTDRKGWNGGEKHSNCQQPYCDEEK